MEVTLIFFAPVPDHLRGTVTAAEGTAGNRRAIIANRRFAAMRPFGVKTFSQYPNSGTDAARGFTPAAALRGRRYARGGVTRPASHHAAYHRDLQVADL